MIKSPTRNIIYNVLLFTLNVGTYAVVGTAAVSTASAALSFLSLAVDLFGLVCCLCLFAIFLHTTQQLNIYRQHFADVKNVSHFFRGRFD